MGIVALTRDKNLAPTTYLADLNAQREAVRSHV
jgi:hypothetical protein